MKSVFFIPTKKKCKLRFDENSQIFLYSPALAVTTRLNEMHATAKQRKSCCRKNDQAKHVKMMEPNICFSSLALYVNVSQTFVPVFFVWTVKILFFCKKDIINMQDEQLSTESDNIWDLSVSLVEIPFSFYWKLEIICHQWFEMSEVHELYLCYLNPFFQRNYLFARTLLQNKFCLCRY